MVDQRKKERHEAPGGGFNPDDAVRRKREIKEPVGPMPTDDPQRRAGGSLK